METQKLLKTCNYIWAFKIKTSKKKKKSKPHGNKTKDKLLKNGHIMILLYNEKWTLKSGLER